MAESLESINSAESEFTPRPGFVTPPPSGQDVTDAPSKRSAVKRLIHLKDECNSPAFRLPPSPLMKQLGYGTGVGVYLMPRSPKASGEIRSPWAIKKILKSKQSNKSLYAERLEYEAGILRKLKHVNIIGYRGFSNPPNDKAFLVMETALISLCDLIDKRLQSLLNAIPPKTPSPFPAKCMEKVALDMANALHYLHEDQKMIHGDIKSANVLIFGDFVYAKLCDFGVSRYLNEDGTVEGFYVGTEIWHPMEVVLQKRGTPRYPITSKADIYPFGLTICEMIALKPPHLPTADDDSDSEKSFDEVGFDEMLDEVLGTRPLIPDVDYDQSYNKILEVFFCCTEEDPADRPTAGDVITLLEFVEAPLRI